jgi:hypothetical protein
MKVPMEDISRYYGKIETITDLMSGTCTKFLDKKIV